MSTTPASSGQPQRLPAVSPAIRQRLQQLFEHGKKSFEKGDTDYAHDLFAQCVAEDPGNLVYLQHFRANLAKKFGDAKKSSRFGGLNMKLKSARSALAKGAEKGDWQAAFAAGCEALKQSPIDIATLLDLADACKAIGATECRLYYLKWALDLDLKHEQANRRAGEALAEVGQFDQAISCWQRVLEVRPTDQAVAKAISHLSVEQTIKKGGYNQDLLRKGSAAHATPQAGAVEEDQYANHDTPAPPPGGAATPERESLEQRLLAAITRDPAEVQHYSDLADHYTANDRLAEAQQMLIKALEVSGGGDLGLRERLEDLQLRQLKQQVEVAQSRAKKEKTTETVELAKRLAAQANQTELEIFAARVERNPGSTQAQFELGARLKRAGKYREAIQAFQAARSDNRRLAEAQLQLGECFQQIEQYRLAMSSYEAAVGAAADPQSDLHKLARYRAGVLAMGLKEFDKAEKHLTELAGVDFGYRDVADRLDKLAQNRNT